MRIDLIERVAKAICDCEAWSSFFSDEDAAKLARAAIAAMREPTEEMVKAGEVADDECSEASPHTASHMIYSAMIDAALGGRDD